MTAKEHHDFSLLQVAAQARAISISYRSGLRPDKTALDRLASVSASEQHAFRAWMDEAHEEDRETDRDSEAAVQSERLDGWGQ